jgi:hypothetical protein
MRVVWTARGLHDLASVRAYIWQDNPAAAERQEARVRLFQDEQSLPIAMLPCRACGC